MSDAARVCGLVLAAGAGSRFGYPKGLASSPDGTPWVRSAVRMLRAAGCDRVIVLVGARGDEVAGLVGGEATVLEVADWRDGLAATLRAGLTAAAATDCELAVITAVDTPDAVPEAVIRVLDVLRARGGDPGDALAQATYRGSPGHPVVIGAHHFASVAAALVGDRGARAYLVANDAAEVECGDLWSGADIDRR